MATITFDTLKFVRRLKDAGVPEVQAEAFTKAFKEAQGESELATQNDIHDVRRDIKDLENRMDTRFERIDGELKLMRWMLGVLLAGVISLVLKAFFNCYPAANQTIHCRDSGTHSA